MSESETSSEPVADAEATVLRVRVSLNGRPVRSHSFTQDAIQFGRDPEADVFLDNPGISRAHLRIEKCPDGWYAQDLGSANGTFLNDAPLQRQRLQHEDVLRIGKFTMWVAIESDRRSASVTKPAAEEQYQGTTVLSTTELEKMMTRSRDLDAELPVLLQTGVRAPTSGKTRRPVVPVVFAFVGGMVVGAGVLWFLVH
jgi:pSer/pThr/pTyr-binding forkhead associated (FHA) protein